MKTSFNKDEIIKVLHSMLATPKYNDDLFRKKNGLELHRNKKETSK